MRPARLDARAAIRIPRLPTAIDPRSDRGLFERGAQRSVKQLPPVIPFRIPGLFLPNHPAPRLA